MAAPELDLSIVTPCFNAARYVRACIESVKRACAGLNYEHVIADGGSTDGTLEILKGSGENVRWFSGRDGGMYDALNKAVAAAKGRWIGHLNTDEQYNPAGLRAALGVLQTGQADAVLGPTVMVDGAGQFLQLFKQVIVPRPVDALWCMPVQSCSFLYRRGLWERCPYDTRFRLVADHVWFRAQVEAGMRMAAIREPIGIFTWHPDNLSNTLGLQKPEDALPDVNRRALRLQLAKHVYRLRKTLAGGYWRAPVSYEIFREGRFETVRVEKPALKLKRERLT